MSLRTYRALSKIIGPVIEAGIKLSASRRSDQLWLHRLGYLLPELKGKGPYDLWIHGVSVGEIGLCNAIYQELIKIYPNPHTIVSSFTQTGFKRACELFKDQGVQIIGYPLDIPRAVNRTVNVIRPRLYCCMETELWPNLLFALKKSGAMLVLVNGRISDASFPKYKKIKFLINDVLSLFDFICAISDEDKNRFLELGAAEQRIGVCGNAKFEGLLKAPSSERVVQIQNQLNLPLESSVVVAGSTRGKEHELLIDAFSGIWERGLDVILILAPRHLDKLEEISNSLQKRKIQFSFFSEIASQKPVGNIKVIVVDKIGVLFDLYGLCDVAFVGGSLVKKGGQNLMEPAAWQKPVIFGPSFDNFKAAGELLVKFGGGFIVENIMDLENVLFKLLSDRAKRVSSGVQARKALERIGRGAALKQALIIKRLLEGRSCTMS